MEVVGHECLHAAAAGAHEYQFGHQEGVAEQVAAHVFGLFVGAQVVDVQHHQPGRGDEAVAAAVGKHAGGGDVGQCALFQCAVLAFLVVAGSVSHLFREQAQAFAAGNEFPYLLQGNFR